MIVSPHTNKLCERFRGFYPVVVDVETAGFDPKKDALLEFAAVTLKMDDDGQLEIDEILFEHIKPFEGANLDPKALAFNGIDPHHPFRLAKCESDALGVILKAIRQGQKEANCQRSVLVGHNPAFDLSFVNAAVARCNIKRNPFHPFASFDTATLGGLAFGQTVLAKAIEAAGLDFDHSQAHSAKYDAERTAVLFCDIVNRWKRYIDAEDT